MQPTHNWTQLTFLEQWKDILEAKEAFVHFQDCFAVNLLALGIANKTSTKFNEVTVKRNAFQHHHLWEGKFLSTKKIQCTIILNQQQSFNTEINLPLAVPEFWEFLSVAVLLQFPKG